MWLVPPRCPCPSRGATLNISLLFLTASNRSWKILAISYSDPFSIAIVTAIASVQALIVFYPDFKITSLMFPLPSSICTTLISLNIHKYIYIRVIDQAIPLPSSQFFHRPLLSIKRRKAINYGNAIQDLRLTSFLYDSALQLLWIVYGSHSICICCSLLLGCTFLPSWTDASTSLTPCFSMRLN